MDDKFKNLVLSVAASLGVGSGSGIAASYYVQQAHSAAIEKIEIRQDALDKLIFVELKEINTRLSRIEGQIGK